MESLIYDSRPSLQQLLAKRFAMPIHFVAVGTNGSLVAGTYRTSTEGAGFDCLITVQTLNAGGLTAPVNIMYVDSKGESALVVLRPVADEAASPHPMV
jgi:hypothetical protein